MANRTEESNHRGIHVVAAASGDEQPCTEQHDTSDQQPNPPEEEAERHAALPMDVEEAGVPGRVQEPRGSDLIDETKYLFHKAALLDYAAHLLDEALGVLAGDAPKYVLSGFGTLELCHKRALDDVVKELFTLSDVAEQRGDALIGTAVAPDALPALKPRVLDTPPCSPRYRVARNSPELMADDYWKPAV